MVQCSAVQYTVLCHLDEKPDQLFDCNRDRNVIFINDKFVDIWLCLVSARFVYYIVYGAKRTEETNGGKKVKLKSHHAAYISYQMHANSFAILLSNCIRLEWNVFLCPSFMAVCVCDSHVYVYFGWSFAEENKYHCIAMTIIITISTKSSQQSVSKRNGENESFKVFKVSQPDQTKPNHCVKFLWFLRGLYAVSCMC